MIESRYNQLMGVYWRASYLADRDPSPAVVEACTICKRVIEREVAKGGYQSAIAHRELKS